VTRALSALNRLAAILRRGTTLTLEAPMPLLAHTDHAPCATCSTTDRTKFDYPADGLCSECLYRLLDALHTDHYPTLEDTVPLNPDNGDADEPGERHYDLEVGERADQAPDAVAARMGICNADLWERRITRDPSTLCSHGNEVRGEWATDCIACENERDGRTCEHGYVGDGDCLACETEFARIESAYDASISAAGDRQAVYGLDPDERYAYSDADGARLHSDADIDRSWGEAIEAAKLKGQLEALRAEQACDLGPVQDVYLAREPIETHCGDAAPTKEAHVPLKAPHAFNYGRLTQIQRQVLAVTHRMTLAACPADLTATLEDECAEHAWSLFGPPEGNSMELSVQLATGGQVVPDDIVGPPVSLTGSYSPVVTSCVIPTQYGDLFFHFCL